MIVIGLLFAVAFVFVAFNAGYNRGVKDTEERWSEAVGRADAHRAMAAGR